MLLNILKVEGQGADSLFGMIVSVLHEEGGLFRDTQMRDYYALFGLGVHCMAHRMNLVIETLSLYPLVSSIEGPLVSLHIY